RGGMPRRAAVGFVDTLARRPAGPHGGPFYWWSRVLGSSWGVVFGCGGAGALPWLWRWGVSSGDVSITVGSGNVFADLGLSNPEERLMRARLASRIRDGDEVRGWTVEQAAEAFSLSEADAARLARGALEGFSVANLRGI